MKTETLKKGDIVKLKRGKKTAQVVAVDLKFNGVPFKGACGVHPKLGGMGYWHEDELVRVKSSRS